MSADEQLTEMIVQVMRGRRAMTHREIVRAVQRRTGVKPDAPRVRKVLRTNSLRFAISGSRSPIFGWGPRWSLIEAGPSGQPGDAGAPVPARPRRPTLSGAAAAELSFREDEPPAEAIGPAT